jgi:hypothetical protein
MEEPVETKQYHGYTIEIHQDPDPQNPREWDNLGKMICFHRGYDLGDKHDMGPEDLQKLVARNDVVSLPLYLLDHSGLWMNTTGFSHIDPQRWDWGQLGYIYVDATKLRKEYGSKFSADSVRKKALKVLESEVKTFNDYLTGNVYGYLVKGPDGSHIDSCWGYYGESGTTDAMKSAMDLVQSPPYQMELPKGSRPRRSRKSRPTSAGSVGIQGLKR